MNKKVLSHVNEKIGNNNLCFGKIFLDKDEGIILLRNRFLSQITGKMIVKSLIMNSTTFSSTADVLFTAYCKTAENKIIKVEIIFDDTHDKNKILAFYYTSRFIENCFSKKNLKFKQPEIFQIRFTDYQIFDDNKAVHSFLYSDDCDKSLKNVIKISFIELPKVNQLDCIFTKKEMVYV